MSENPLKAKLAAKTPTVACWLSIPHPSVVEVIALSGCDAVIIDHEHGPWSLSETALALQVLQGTGTSAIIRVPSHDPAYVKRVLDTGAMGIMFPSVDTPAQAAAVVAACHYPPRGIRGHGLGAARVAEFGLRAGIYEAAFPDALVVICQIESMVGASQVAQIAAVPGIDCLFVGPADLSGSLGKLGRFDDAEVIAAIRAAEHDVLASGLALGTTRSLGRNSAAVLADGATLIASITDAGLLRDGVLAEMAAAKPTPSEPSA